MNERLGTPYAPTDALDGAVPTLNLPDLIATAMMRRGDLAAARLAVDAARQALGAARAQRAPRIDLSASEGNVQPVVTTGYHPQFAVGLTAVWKLFDNGYSDGAIAQAQAALGQAQLEVERMQTGVELDVRQAYIELDTARQLVVASQQLVALSGENRRLAEVRYRGGVGTALELRDAELRDDSAQSDLVESQRSLKMSLVAVRFAAGLL